MAKVLRLTTLLISFLPLASCGSSTTLPAFTGIDRIVVTQPKYKNPTQPIITAPALVQTIVTAINKERTSDPWVSYWPVHTYHPCTIRLNLYAGSQRVGHFAYNIAGKHFTTGAEAQRFPPEHIRANLSALKIGELQKLLPPESIPTTCREAKNEKHT